jgi:hypothetical protein
LSPVEWAILASYWKSHPDFKINNLPEDTLNFLYRIGLFQSVSIPYTPKNYSTHPQTHIVDLLKVTNEQECEKIAAIFYHICTNILGERNDEFYDNLKKIINEISTNIIHHANA